MDEVITLLALPHIGATRMMMSIETSKKPEPRLPLHWHCIALCEHHCWTSSPLCKFKYMLVLLKLAHTPINLNSYIDAKVDFFW